MNHADHVDFLRAGVPGSSGQWADLGSGAGAFTLALADLIGPEGVIYSVDRDHRALAEQQAIMQKRFRSLEVHCVTADFTRPLALPPMDGVVMANSLHYHKQKAPIIQAVRRLLRTGARLILVEYNVDRGNPWVPYPISYPAWEALASRCGFAETRQIGTKPSRFLREMYSAVSLNLLPLARHAD